MHQIWTVPPLLNLLLLLLNLLLLHLLRRLVKCLTRMLLLLLLNLLLMWQSRASSLTHRTSAAMLTAPTSLRSRASLARCR